MRPTPGTCAIYLRVLYWLLVLVHLSPHHFTKLLGVRCIWWRSLRKDCCTSGLKLEWFLWLTTGLNMRILPTVSTKNFPQIQRSHKSLSFPNAKNNYSKYIHTCIYIYIHMSLCLDQKKSRVSFFNTQPSRTPSAIAWKSWCALVRHEQRVKSIS